jgi:hypothetical protein
MTLLTCYRGPPHKAGGELSVVLSLTLVVVALSSSYAQSSIDSLFHRPPATH